MGSRKKSGKKKDDKSYGAVALSGYIYQTLYAIMTAMEDTGWDRVKVEPVTTKGKTDIAFYRDEAYEAVNITLSGRQKTYKKIQVKKRSGKVRIGEIEKWVEELRGDDPAEFYEVCLFGNPKYVGKLPENVRVLSNDIDQVQKDVKDKINDYCKKKGVKRCSDWDLEVVSALLFKKLTINALERDPITKGQLEGMMAGILEKSPEYIAEAIRIISQRRFMENPGYERDLKPARLDESGRKNMEDPPNLRPEEFPEVRFAADSEERRFNLFNYVKAHVGDEKITRHIYLSAESGSGKSTCIYYLWKEYLGDEAVIPVYVPLYKLRKSITSYIVSRYMNPESSVDFYQLKYLFSKMSRQIVLFLDGYNELAANINKEVQEEIKDFFYIDQVTVIITSTDEGMTLREDITELRLCCLSNSQIETFLGGHREYLPEKHYEGMLTNPFMLEKVIESFGDQKEKLESINQISKAKVLREYIKNQMNNIELKPVDKIGLNVVLPLAAMKLDERIHSGYTALMDPKRYDIDDFESAAEDVRKDLGTYRALIRDDSGARFGGIDYTSKVLEIEDWVKWLCDAGKALEIFNQDSDISVEVAWDHEIYRDYYTAKGYAIYCTYNKDAEDCVHNLAKQINCGYRDPLSGEAEVKPFIREHLVSKAQMFIDMVDESSEGYNDRLKALNESAVYRRLTRDTALIYEDMNVFNMVAAAELSLHHYRDVRAICEAESRYDYEDKDRRMAEAAFSISELAYIFMHEKVPGEDKKKYLECAWKNLVRADEVFGELEKKEAKVLDDRTVRNYMLINQGNHAAYLFAEAKYAGDEKKKKEDLEKALAIHLSNLKKREVIRAEINGEGGDDSEIRCSIAKSYIGIATAYYKMGKYKESIENNKKAVEISPDHNDQIRGCRNISGNYAEMREYEKEELSEAVRWIGKGIRLVKKYRAYSYYGDLKKNLLKIKAGLSEEQRAYIQEKLHLNEKILSCPDAGLPQNVRIKALENTIAAWIRSDELAELVRMFGGVVRETGTLKEQIGYYNSFAEVWDYRKKKANGGERWLVQEDDFIKEHSAVIMEHMGQLGLTGITEPEQKPDYILPLGGARMSNLDRCLAAEEVCEKYPGEAIPVIALTGMRPVNEIERPFLEQYAPEAQTEYDAVCGGIEKAFHLPEGSGTEEVHFNENINLSWAERRFEGGERMIHVLSAPSTDPERRANSMDTFRFFLDKYQPKPGSRMLLVTSCIYVPFQLMKFMDLALANDFYVDCIGNRDYAHSPTVLNAASYLQELKAAINAIEALAEKYFE